MVYEFKPKKGFKTSEINQNSVRGNNLNNTNDNPFVCGIY